MEYRDERDALRARLESLETELASARAEAERMEATENALRAARRENEALRAELGRLGPAPKRPLGAAVVLASVVLVFVAAGGALFLIAGTEAPPPPLSPIDLPGAPDEPAVRPVAPSPAPDSPKSARRAVAEWKARVVRSTGVPLAIGTPCTVRATLTSDGTTGEQPAVSIGCAGKVLYDSTHALSGMANLSYTLEEVPGEADGTFRYALSYEDQGPRTGERAQASVSTFERTASAWKDTAPAHRVELALDELSGATAGAALFTEHERADVPFRRALRRTGTITAASGTGLVRAGEACSVEVRPAFGSEQCRVWVKCGEATLYGASGGGFARCSVEGSAPFAAADTRPSSDDRDPVLELLLGRETLTVRDDTPNVWSVNVALTP